MYVEKEKHPVFVHMAVETFLLIVEEKLKTQLIKITLKLGHVSLLNCLICSREQIDFKYQKWFCAYFDIRFKTPTNAWALFR